MIETGGTEDLAQFRRECRVWLEANCPAEMRQPMTHSLAAYWGGRRARFSSEAEQLWFERMVEKGWTAPSWPREYGGAGLSLEQTEVLKEEMARIDARPPLIGFGMWMLGPAVLEYGTDEQKRTLLPAMARGEIRWCQGYSETTAGSDLASLRTRAELDGDTYVVDGSKIWSSYANEADWIFCLVRSEPEASKQRGISILLFDLASPGVTISPIVMIDGSAEFCQIFFDQVRVPKSHLLGPAGGGWTIAKRIMEFEREMIGASEFETPPVPGDLGETMIAYDPAIDVALARYDVDLIAFQAAAEQLAADAAAGAPPLLAAASVMKLEGANLEVRRKELALQIAGWDGLAWAPDEDTRALTAIAWLRARGSAIAGGTNEVQLNIIAKHALQLT